MSYITPTDVVFDADRLAADWQLIERKFPNQQVNLRTIDERVANPVGFQSSFNPVIYGNGSLHVDGVPWENDRNWIRYIDRFNDLYIIDVCRAIEQYVKAHMRLGVGRARLLTLRSKDCLTLHRDYDNILRVHVPIVTNSSCFFVNNDTVGRMPDAGRMYLFDSTVLHTAVNASRERRTHLVVNCFTLIS